MAKRRIGVVTGTRAEYGVLYWLLKEIQNRPDLELQLLVTGMHLSSEHGFTVQEIEADGFPIAERIEILLSSDREVAVSTSIGIGIIRFAEVFDRVRPDILVMQGDRFESMAAAIPAMMARIPIAHISGGKSTQGVMDEAIRHALTKMSHLHFTHTEAHRERIIKMGEEPGRVFAFGSPLVDGIKRLKPLSRSEVQAALGISLDEKFFIVAYHPVTLENRTEETQMNELLRALDEFKDVQAIFIMPNADPGGTTIARKISAYTGRHPGSVSFKNVSRSLYLNLQRFAQAMIGNSSSGLTEAPSFGLPAVNIGDRQSGMIKAGNVVDCVPDQESIAGAIRKALDPSFRKLLAGAPANPFGDGAASERIVGVLARAILGERLLKKRFYDYVPTHPVTEAASKPEHTEQFLLKP